MCKITSTFSKLLFVIALILNVSNFALAQCPPPSGINTFANPFDLGVLGVGSPYNSVGNNMALNCYTNNYTGATNQASPDAFYKITTGPCTDKVMVSTCSPSTALDTYIHFLDAAGAEIASNDNATACAAAPGASELTQVGLLPNTVYYIVVEGAGVAEDSFDLTIQEFDDVPFTVVAAAPSVCLGNPASLTATPTNGVGLITYVWTPSFTGTPGTGSPYTIASTVATDEDVYDVVATDVNMCSATDFTFLTVNALPTVAPSPDVSLCASATAVSISATFGGAATMGTWSFSNPGGGTLSSSSIDGSLESYTLAGNDLTGPFPKNIVFTITTDAPSGCAAATGTVTITITGNPNLITTPPAAICVGGSVDLATTVTDANATSGTTTWYPTQIDADTEMNALGSTTVMPILTTRYWVRKNISPTACFDIDSVLVTVNPLPTITLGAVANVCQDATSFALPYTATTNAPNQYSITTGAMALTGFVPVTLSALGASAIAVTIPGGSAAGTYDFNITVKNTITGCVSAIVPFTLIIDPLPTAAFTYTAAAFCKDITSAPATNTGTTGGTYTSTVGLILDATTGEINPSTSTPGTYVVNYTVTNASTCSSSTTRSVTINPIPTATIAYATPFCNNATPTTANATQTGQAGGTYAAAPAGLVVNPTTGQVNIATSTPGTYTVTYSFSALGCASSTTASVVINAIPTPTIVFPTFCFRSPATVGVSAVYSAYNWTSSDAAANSTTATITNTILLTPPFTYRVTVTDVNGCTGTTTASVTAAMILPRPTISFVSSITACQGQTANLSVNLTDGTPWTLVYAVGGVAQPSVSVAASPYSIPVNTAAIGTQNFTITSLTNATCAALPSDLTPVTATATVSAAPAAPTVAPNPVSVCLGATITLTPAISPSPLPFTSTYGFEGSSPAATTTGTGASGVVTSSFTTVGLGTQSYTTGTAPTAGGAFTNNGWNASPTGAYWEYTMTAAPNHTIDVSSVSFNLRRSSTGPAAIVLEAKVDAAAFAPLTLSNSAPTNGSFGAPLVHSATASITGASVVVFRIKATAVAAAAAVSTGTLRIDNLAVDGLSMPIYTANYYSDAALTTLIGTGAAPTYAYTTTAALTTPATIYVNYSGGACPSLATAVPVTVNTPPTLTATTPVAVCADTPTVTLVSTVGATATMPVDYVWTVPATATNGSQGSLPNRNEYTIAPVAATEAGNYVVVATNVCGSSTATIVVTVNALPEIASVSHVCSGITATVIPVVAAPYTYNLMAQTGGTPPSTFPFSQNNNPTFTLGAGTVNAQFTITDANSCKSLPKLGDFSACSGGALPVKLTYFRGTIVAKDNQLAWVTATEQNSAWFIIEASIDGLSFKEVGRKRAAGNSNLPLTYAFTHSDVSASMYYRLRIMDLDGSFEYSNTVYLRRNKGSLAVNNIFPNPTEGMITVQYEVEKSSKLQFVITDELGRRLSTKVIEAVAGVNNQPLDLADFPGGTYFLLIDEADGKRTVRRVIKN